MTVTDRLSLIFVPLLSMMMPGLGQFIAGHRRAASTFYSFSVLLYGLLWGGIYKTFYGLLMWLFTLLAGYVFNVTHAYYVGKKANRAVCLAYRRTTIYLVGAGLHLAFIALILYHLGLPIKAYHIPTASMSPTLQVGDYFLVERTGTDSKIQRGDIVVFPSPTNDNIVYVKRVIGLPGDILEIVKNRVWINGKQLDESYLEKDHTKHPTYGSSHYGPLAVPASSVYVLGDNRFHSADSRLYKSIEIEKIKSKSLFIIWSNDAERIGKHVR